MNGAHHYAAENKGVTGRERKPCLDCTDEQIKACSGDSTASCKLFRAYVGKGMKAAYNLEAERAGLCQGHLVV